MSSYWDGFVGGVLAAILAMVTAGVLVLCWPEIAAGARWLGRGLRELANATRLVFQPPPVTLPRWVRRIRERVGR